MGMTWIWITIGWAGLAVFAILVRQRMKRSAYRIPPEVAEFTRSLRRELALRHPEVLWKGVVPGRFTAILAVGGQETPVPLHSLFRHAQAFPDALADLVDRLIAEIRLEGLETAGDHEFADVAVHVLPQVRTRDWICTQAPVFGQGSIVHRELGADLSICYVIDDSWSMVFVSQGHLERWGRSEDDLYHLAISNLHRSVGSEMPMPEADDPVLVMTGDGYDAARLLLLDPESVDGLLVAVPDRDVLWLADPGEDSDKLDELQRLAAQQCERAPHPLSPSLYLMAEGRLEKLALGVAAASH